MKKIYSLALAAVAILSAASCQKELVNETVVDNGGDAFKVTAISATDSKTVLDGVNTYWTPGDLIALYDANGAEVTFSTDITETAAKAVFTAESEFVPHEHGLLAVYPKRTDRGATSYANGVVTGLHIGGTQQAVAGSFDPKYAVALGVAISEDTNDLLFVNVHSLVKFTVGGETAPSKVTLKNNGMRMIAGMYNVDVNTGEATVTNGAGEITLNGPFEVGKTYYIALTHGVCGNGITLYYDDVEMKNTGETITLEPNKIYNLGTLPAPAEEPEQPADIWAGENVVSYDLPGDASSKRQVLRNIKYVADAENLYIKLKASASLFVEKNAAYLGLMLFDTVTGTTGSGYWGWWNDAKGDTEFNAEHAGVFTGTDLVVKVGETEVVAVTETSGDDLVWTMAIPRSAHAVLAGAKAYMGVLVMETFEPCGAMPDKYADMLEVVLP